MKVSTSWLKELLRRTMLDDEIVAALERAGVEVEQYISSKPIDKKVVVALVKKVVQHPGADRLKIATVDNGREELQIVCGAANVRAGMLAPLAQVGSILPDGSEIKAAKLRGEVSEGMLCSERELGLGDSHAGLLELGDGVEPGKLLCDLFPADGSVDIKTPANRFDLLGTVGLAREVAAMTDNALVLPPADELDGEGVDVLVGKLVEGCRRLIAVELTVQPDAPTPAWMATRLAVAGIRSLGLVVDVTNYVMLETAQPLHAYDAASVALPIGVRSARRSELLKTLDGTDRQLYPGDLVITDADGIIGLAGIRGGAATEISPRTTRIYLEAASFDGVAVRQAAKRHNLRTDASSRFERSVPPRAALVAMERAVALLKQLGGASVTRWQDKFDEKEKKALLSLNTERASKLLGFVVTPAEATVALGRLGIEAKAKATNLSVTVPWWRPDLKLSEDLLEELVRVVGYDRVPATLPVWRPAHITFDTKRPKLARLRELLSGAGLFEVMTYSFVSAEQLSDMCLSPDEHLALKNPLSSEQAYLRSGLLASHIAVAERNRTYARTLEMYEVSHVFRPRAAGEQPAEPLQLGALVVRPAEAYRRLKGLLDGVAREYNVALEFTPVEATFPWAPGRVAEIKLGQTSVGTIGQLHPSLVTAHRLGGEAAAFELSLEPILAAAAPRRFSAPSRFPVTRRDVAVVVPVAVTWQAVAKELAKLPQASFGYVSDYSGGDVPSGFRSLAIHVELTHPDRTPTDAEADDLETKVRSVLHRRFGAKERS